jgi:dihydrolipoamide dehydrogenase
MAESPYDLIVIGAGPGGYVAAIRAAQLGMRVACVEKEFLGGTCLNIGCIPSKALLESSQRYRDAHTTLARHGVKVGNVELDLAAMMKRKGEVVKALTTGVGFLFKKNKIDHLQGAARIPTPNTVEVIAAGGSPRSYTAKRILIATGSAPTALPSIPFDSKYILSSTEALALPEVPRKLLIVGAGYIGLEMGSVWNRLGSEVMVLEFLDRALPGMDRELAALLQRTLEKQGLKFRFNTSAESAQLDNGKVKITWKSGGESGVEEADRVLVAIGRKPVTDGLGLNELGVKRDAKGFIPVNQDYATNIPGIYAIGDVIGGLMLAHKAEDEGVAAVERMAGQAGHVNYNVIPAVVYTHPELATVGLTEEEAKVRQITVKIGKFPFLANGRARSIDETDGLVKMVADAASDRVLGVQILGPHASDLIAEAMMVMEFGGSSEDIARSCHAHPTLAEAVKEAALAVAGRAIHI